MSKYDLYENPLPERYASREITKIFSRRTRVSTWRKLWLWLAEAEKELGLAQITDGAIEAIRSNLIVTDESFKVAEAEEKIRRHDVMAHVFALEKDAPAAAGIIHIGATSCYGMLVYVVFPNVSKASKQADDLTKVTDNADLIFMRDALALILPKLAKVIHNLSQFALQFKDLPTLGFTHYQAAQPISLGRRAAQWAQDLAMDLDDIEAAQAGLRLRGAQGTTGTQASFLEIFHGDAVKIDRLNEMLCEKAGFPACYDISTQTYSRKVDLRIANALSSFGASAIHIATDLRLSCHDKIVDEPHEATQTGSSAMAFKTNPMRCERICALARKLSNLNSNFASTYSSQWLERSLDDSAIRRMDIPEMFLLTDAILITLDNVTSGLVVYPAMIRRQMDEELPFMAMEGIIMRLVHKGVSRQEAHERIRVLSLETVREMKTEGANNTLMEKIKRDDFFKSIWADLDELLDPKKFTGRSEEIVERYFAPSGPIAGKLEKYKGYIDSTATATLHV
ncbi:MAG: adenylosuccinase ade13 [Ramalina farinacea]|uniref:Adenylosuccinase ade13 n=1 Tax=Ramalina farinacea TaxID=258253 RepID=A0AA43TN33_9LECA|nr:adenylosuccinase ade13 [Ramalina farinacea]